MHRDIKKHEATSDGNHGKVFFRPETVSSGGEKALTGHSHYTTSNFLIKFLGGSKKRQNNTRREGIAVNCIRFMMIYIFLLVPARKTDVAVFSVCFGHER